MKKSNGTLYWTGTGSDTLAESDLSGTMQKEYIFFNGKRVARRDLPGTPSTKYYFSDHLGSAGVITNDVGFMSPPLEESDYYPYGGEIPITNGDPNTYKFTGKERDSESGLDNFGKRYHASSLARFMTPDPIGIMKQKLRDPQQWNMYAYVRNNPLRFIDPLGLYTTSCTSGDISKCDQNTQNFEKARQAALQSKDKNVVAAAKAYGDYHQSGTKGDNVSVAFQTKENSNVQLATDSKGAVTSINVSINTNTLSGITQEKDTNGETTLGFARAVADVAHEGSHVQTDQALIDHHMDPAFNLTIRQAEHPAYKITDSVLRSYGWAGADASGNSIDLGNDEAIDKFLDSIPTEGREPLNGHIYTPPQ